MMRLLFKAYKGRKLLYEKICRTHGSLKITLDEALINNGATKIIIEKLSSKEEKNVKEMGA